MLSVTVGTNLGSGLDDGDAQLVGVVVVVLHVGAHLAPVVREEDALARPQAHAAHPAEPGPDQLRVPVLPAALPTVKTHCVPSVRRQVYAIVVLRERRWRLHRLNHPRVVQPVLPQRRYPCPYYGPLRQPFTRRHRSVH